MALQSGGKLNRPDVVVLLFHYEPEGYGCDSAVNRDLSAIPNVFVCVGGGAITWPTGFQGGHANLDLVAPSQGGLSVVRS